MPGGDRTGPLGEGQMTGKGFGWCGGFGFGRGRGRSMRRGMGFGQRWGASVYQYDAPYSQENEAEILRQQAKNLEDSLEQINKRLTQMEEQTKKDKSDKK